jgi:hypothetical protein
MVLDVNVAQLQAYFKALIEKIRNIHILVEIDKLLQASEEVFPSSAGKLQFGRFGANAIS